MSTIFLDRDGVINANGFVNSVEDFEFLDGTFEALRILFRHHRLFVITNQGGIEAGHLTEADLAEIHAFMKTQIVLQIGKTFSRIYHCPHLNSPCACRKPRTFNRTSMELKPHRHRPLNHLVLPFNRTSMELKRRRNEYGRTVVASF